MEIKFKINDSYLPIPVYVVVLDKVLHVAASQDPFNWIVYINGNWIVCDKRYAPAIYTIKTYKDLQNAIKEFPELRTDFYYVLTKVVPIPLNVRTVSLQSFKALLQQLSEFISQSNRK